MKLHPIPGFLAMLCLAFSAMHRARANEQTIEQITTAADKGDAEAQYRLGQALLSGVGVKKDSRSAYEYLQKAAAQGHADAIGEFYYHGKYGHKQDYEKAREHLQKAADADNASAQNMLGAMYRNGVGVPMNFAKAEHWFRKAAEQGDPKSMSNLGQILGPDGPDATKSVEAMKWLLLAHRANEPMARNLLNEILRTRPPEIVKEAQKQMNEFKPRASSER